MATVAAARPIGAHRTTMRAGVTLGVGLGGFMDGIALHQVAHWHNMGSSILPPTTFEALKTNMVWDGLFHAAVWLVTLAGVYLLLGDARRGAPLPGKRAFTGQMLIGWGSFNLVEGIVDHHLLDLHHVRDLPAHVPAYDWLFLLIAGVGFVGLGLLLSRGGRDDPARAPETGSGLARSAEQA